MQQGNLKFHFSLFLCVIYFSARKGDFLPFPFYLHLLPFLYIGLMIHLTLSLLLISSLTTDLSFKNLGIQVPFCSIFFLFQLLLTDTAWLVLPTRLQITGNLLSYHLQFLRTHSHLSQLPCETLPHLTIADKPQNSRLQYCVALPEKMTAFRDMDRNSQLLFTLAILNGHYFWKSTTQLMAASEFLCSSAENTNTQHCLLK